MSIESNNIQSRDASLPSSLDSTAPLLRKISDAERTDVLKSLKHQAKFDMQKEKKKQFIMVFIDMKEEMLKAAAMYDSSKQNTALALTLNATLNPTTKKGYKLSNDKLAAVISSYYDQFSTLRDYFVAKKVELQDNRERLQSSRSSTSSLASSLLPMLPPDEEKVSKKLDSYFILMDKIDEIVREKRAGGSNVNSAMKFPVLTNVQKSRTWKAELVPVFPSHRVCAFCNHESINEQEENKDLKKYNSRVQEKYKNEMNIFEKHLKAKEQGGLSSELPAGMNEKRRPRMMQVKKVRN